MRLNSSTIQETPEPTIRIYSTPDPFETQRNNMESEGSLNYNFK